MANLAMTGGSVTPPPTTIKPPRWMAGSSTPLPQGLQWSAARAPKPVYSGPHINSVPKTASALGAPIAVNQGGVYVNGNKISPTRYVNGEPHAPVHQVAQAAGYPSTHVIVTPGKTTVMPHATASSPLLREGSAGSQVAQLQHMLEAAGYNVGPTGADGQFGQHTLAAVRQFQTDHHLSVDGVVGPNTWGALKSYHASAPVPASHPGNPAPAPTQPAPAAPTDPLSQVLQGNPTLQTILGSTPQAPAPIQMPTAPTVQPFNFDQQQAYQNAIQQFSPTYMNQMAAADQKLNAGLNSRNIWNSGLAQQMQDQQDQSYYDKLDQAAMTQANSDYKTALTAWNDNMTQVLNNYKAQIQSAYDQGQLNDKEYNTAITQWNDAAKYLQDMYDQHQTMQKALLPWTMGPTPQQQITDSLSQQKLNAQVQQWAASDKLKAEQIAQSGELGQAKLQVTIARDTQLAQEAAQSASQKATSEQLTGLHDQLVSVASRLSSMQASGATAAQMKPYTDQYNKILSNISAVVAAEGN